MMMEWGGRIFEISWQDRRDLSGSTIEVAEKTVSDIVEILVIFCNDYSS
jgi:hypothetical protein